MRTLIGGYTKQESKGIYELVLTETASAARLEAAKNIITVGGPTYFQVDRDLLFTITNAGSQGGISSFKKITSDYQKVDEALHDGSSPAYLGINFDKQLLYTANYHTGDLAVFNYSETGKLTLITKVTHEALTLGPRPEQVDGPHPHFFDETPKGNLVSCDLGNDTVDFYQFSDKQLKHLASYQNEAGFGTRHIVFSPDGHYFYVVGELSSKINLVKFDEQSWTFENLATYSTIPSGWNEHNGAAALRISNDGKFIYVSNRGNDSITVFGVNDDHTLHLVQRISTFGEFPRDFNWDEEQKYLVVANQNSNNATLYARNADNGCLTPLQKNIPVPEGTRVLFTE